MQIDNVLQIANQGFMEPSRDEILRWIRGVLKDTGTTPTALARKAGIASTTLTRFLNENDKTVLSFRSIAKIAHAASVPPLGLSPTEPREVPDEAVPYNISKAGLLSRIKLIEAAIGDRPAASAWLMQSRVLEDAGYLPGDILIVDLNRSPQAGETACVQVSRWSSGKTDTVFRIYEPPYLVASSRDAASRKPLLADNDRVIIKGVVTEMIRFGP